MLKDQNHDLVQQLSEISDSLWRMEAYKKNADECDSCKEMWEKMKGNYENHVEMLKDEIAKHVREKRFD
ncbi:MAG: hypothetical protein WC519_00895 [Parcubacteria group bacterium]